MSIAEIDVIAAERASLKRASVEPKLFSKQSKSKFLASLWISGRARFVCAPVVRVFYAQFTRFPHRTMYVCKTLFKHASLDNYLQLISTRGVTQIKYINTHKITRKKIT